MLIVTIGGWDVLQGAKLVQVAYIVLYFVVAFFVARWNRGVLPVIAALAIILLIFAAVAGPAVVRPRQGRLRRARRIDADVLGPGHADHHPGPGPADRLRDARLPAGLERRGRASSRRLPMTSTGGAQISPAGA